MSSRTQSSLSAFVTSLSGFIVSLLVEAFLVGVAWLLLTATPFHPTIEGLLGQDPKAAWHMTRAVATVSYILLTASVAWGLALSSKIAKDVTPAPVTLDMHATLSWLALGLGAYHGFLLLLDTYYHYTLVNILIPFNGPYRPIEVGLGTLALWLMLLASASFSWRAWLGQKNWRLLHYLTFVAYGLATLHGVLAGTDSREPGMIILYASSALLTLFLTNYRLMAGGKQRRQAAESVA